MSPSTVTVEDLEPSPTAVEEPPPTLRFARSELTAALAAMDLADAMEADESTRIVSAESNARLLARAFEPDADEEPTLDVVAPPIPAGLPSPIGDDVLASVESTGSMASPMGVASARERAVTPPKTSFASGALDDLELPFLASLPPRQGRAATVEGPPSATGAWSASDPASPSQVDEHIPLVRSGVRERLTPEAAQAIVDRRARADDGVARSRTRWLVFGIWATAISLAAALGVIAATSPATRATLVDVHAMEHAP